MKDAHSMVWLMLQLQLSNNVVGISEKGAYPRLDGGNPRIFPGRSNTKAGLSFEKPI